MIFGADGGAGEGDAHESRNWGVIQHELVANHNGNAGG